ncbi:hypothetical protein GpartN1_g5314.t1 [Galdieria partita]|uniref:Cytochrome c oxidase assembly protein COX20, mitochondrial n=1 Tax=Galdieria partita TaxID=83374 RepID=A0A9C7US83_9RHOD|nr:hypothetical protein GpartN1_g5314.t1 [Galdieria partita]
MTNSSTSSSENTDFLYKPQKIPCFRQTMLYGLTGGLVLGALRFYRTRNPWKTTDVAVFGTLLFSSVSWVLCRYEYRSYREQLRKSFDLQQEKLLFDKHNETEKPNNSAIEDSYEKKT